MAAATAAAENGCSHSASRLLWDDDDPPKFPSRANDASSLRVLWWNVQHGETASHLEAETGANPLHHNLDAISSLASSEGGPDAIILSEYQHDTLTEKLLEKMKHAYPYGPPELFYGYNPEAQERGIAVFSRRRCTVRRTALLDYYPPEYDDLLAANQRQMAIEKYKSGWRKDFPPERFFPRLYLEMECSTSCGGVPIRVVPFHALQHIEKDYQRSGNSSLGRLFIKLRFVLGRSNPLVHQLQRLRKEMDATIAEPDENGTVCPTLLIGDFNLVHQIGGFLTPYPYTVLSSGLVDLFEDGKKNRVPTWPMPSDQAFGRKGKGQENVGSYQFDHAFATSLTSCKGANVLPLFGSDHAALVVDVAPALKLK